MTDATLKKASTLPSPLERTQAQSTNNSTDRMDQVRTSIKRIIKDVPDSRERKHYKHMLDEANSMAKQERKDKESLQKEITELRQALTGCNILSSNLEKLQVKLQKSYEEFAEERKAKEAVCKHNRDLKNQVELAQVEIDSLRAQISLHKDRADDLQQKLAGEIKNLGRGLQGIEKLVTRGRNMSRLIRSPTSRS